MEDIGRMMERMAESVCEACFLSDDKVQQEEPIPYQGHRICWNCHQRWEKINQYFQSSKGRDATWAEFLDPPEIRRYLDFCFHSHISPMA